jgi:hypothetical protein
VLFGEEYPGRPVDAPRSRVVLRAWWLARLVDHADQAALALFVVPALTGALGVAAVVTGRYDGWQSVGWVRTATGYGTYGIVTLLLLAYALGVAAFRVPATRRSLGILWDLGAFWPRAVHPLAAPCYAERTVPDLVHRVRWYADEGDRPDGEAAAIGIAGRYPGGRVVLAGHSQGSVIAVAALLQLPVEARGHVAFLTYGSVLRRLYARYFPAYFSVTLLADLAGTLTGGDGTRWRNLWRTSDYLGGPLERGPLPGDPRVGAASPLAGTDVRLTDPRYDDWPGDLTPPAIRRHSGYPADPRFREEVATLAGMVPG